MKIKEEKNQENKKNNKIKEDIDSNSKKIAYHSKWMDKLIVK